MAITFLLTQPFTIIVNVDTDNIVDLPTQCHICHDLDLDYFSVASGTLFGAGEHPRCADRGRSDFLGLTLIMVLHFLFIEGQPLSSVAQVRPSTS